MSSSVNGNYRINITSNIFRFHSSTIKNQSNNSRNRLRSSSKIQENSHHRHESLYSSQFFQYCYSMLTSGIPNKVINIMSSILFLPIINLLSIKTSISSSSFKSSWLIRTFILFLISKQVSCQQEQICACSPSIFTFKLDFDGTCPPENVITGPETGVDAIFCQVAVEPLQGYSASSKEDLTPVTVSQISVFELDSQLSVIKQSFLTGLKLENGDYYTYSSIIGDYNPNDPETNEIPGGLQVLLKGENSKGISISNSFILTYTNRCDVIPFSTDDSIGWNNIVGVDPPPYQLCPLYPPLATDAPTSAPTSAPTIAPITVSPTSSPTISPTLPPLLTPTVIPTTSIPVTSAAPTEAPVTSAAPTEAAVTSAAPTETPVTTIAPTEAPVTTIAPIVTTLEPTEDISTETPTHSPTDMVLSMDYNWIFYDIDFGDNNNNRRRNNRRKLQQQKSQVRKHLRKRLPEA